MTDANISKCSETGVHCKEDAAHLSASVFDMAKDDHKKPTNSVSHALNEVGTSFHDVFTPGVHSTTREKLIVGGTALLAVGAIVSGALEFGGPSLLAELELTGGAAAEGAATTGAATTGAAEIGALTKAEVEALMKAPAAPLTEALTKGIGKPGPQEVERLAERLLPPRGAIKSAAAKPDLGLTLRQ